MFIFGPNKHPSIHWDIQVNRLLLDGLQLEPSAAFLRYDVFNHMADARIGLDFAAADYKTCADTGKLKFLEVNTAPMFVAFDCAEKAQSRTQCCALCFRRNAALLVRPAFPG